MQKAFQNFIRQNQLCSKTDKILLAVSGGLDSVVMLSLFQQGGYEIGIAHCNFRLRGVESDADENFVRKLANESGIDSFSKSFDTQSYADEHKLSIQEAARDLRYAWFEETAEKNAFDRIAIAQHSDDQVETFFINLFRGSGTTGLKGMPAKRGKIIRPLLFTDRDSIQKYAETSQLQFREDSSNASEKYLRNKIRHQLIPVLENISPQAIQSIEKSLQYLQEDNILLQQFVESKKDELLLQNDDGFLIPIESLLQMKFTNIWLFYLLKDFSFNRQTTNNLDTLLQNEEVTSSGKTFYSATHKILFDREYLIVQKIQEEVTNSTFLINQNEKEITEPLSLKFEIEKNDKDYSFDPNHSFAYLDVNKLKFPLTLRKWRQGDRFKPFGMKGSKLVSDYLIDNKVDKFSKEDCWVIISAGEISWVVGYRSSEDFRVAKASNQILKIQLITTD